MPDLLRSFKYLDATQLEAYWNY